MKGWLTSLAGQHGPSSANQEQSRQASQRAVCPRDGDAQQQSAGYGAFKNSSSRHGRDSNREGMN
jgi:hypothetical protein